MTTKHSHRRERTRPAVVGQLSCDLGFAVRSVRGNRRHDRETDRHRLTTIYDPHGLDAPYLPTGHTHHCQTCGRGRSDRRHAYHLPTRIRPADCCHTSNRFDEHQHQRRTHVHHAGRRQQHPRREARTPRTDSRQGVVLRSLPWTRQQLVDRRPTQDHSYRCSRHAGCLRAVHDRQRDT